MKTNPTYIEIEEAIENAKYQIEMFNLENESSELMIKEKFIDSMTALLNNTPKYLEEKTTTEIVEDARVDVFTQVAEIFANDLVKYYKVANKAYKEEMEKFNNKESNFYSTHGIKKHFGETIAMYASVSNRKVYQEENGEELFNEYLYKRALGNSKDYIENIQSKIRLKLKGEIARMENVTIGQGGNLDGDFYNEKGEGLNCYTIRAEGDIQKPHLRLLTRKIK